MFQDICCILSSGWIGLSKSKSLSEEHFKTNMAKTGWMRVLFTELFNLIKFRF